MGVLKIMKFFNWVFTETNTEIYKFSDDVVNKLI